MDNNEAILKAASELLAERGLAAITLDDVVVRAGVHPAAVYRQWRSRSDLAAELLRRDVEAHELPDEGELRADLLVVLTRFVQTAHRLRFVLCSVIGESARDPELVNELHLFLASWQYLARSLISRAVERGELPAKIDIEWAVDLLASIVWFRTVVPGDFDVARAPQELVDPILRAWGASSGTSQRP